MDGSLLPQATTALPDEKRRTLTELADGATQALTRIVHWVLLLAPLGIFALVAGAVAQFGWSLVASMAVFVVTLIVGLAVFIGGVYVPTVTRPRDWESGATSGRFARRR